MCNMQMKMFGPSFVSSKLIKLYVSCPLESEETCRSNLWEFMEAITILLLVSYYVVFYFIVRIHSRREAMHSIFASNIGLFTNSYNMPLSVNENMYQCSLCFD
jgi:hypothetical protein